MSDYICIHPVEAELEDGTPVITGDCEECENAGDCEMQNLTFERWCSGTCCGCDGDCEDSDE